MVLQWISVTLAMGLALAQTPPGGRIDGRVNGRGSNGIAGATVVVVSDRESIGKTGPLVLNGVTDERGEFSLAGVPDGLYRICVVAAGYLDPCQWLSAESVRVKGVSVAARINLVEGQRLEVSVTDETGVLDAEESKIEGAFLSVNLIDGTGMRRIVPLAQSGKNGRIYADLIPPSVPFTLEVSSQRFAIGELSGARAVDGRLRLPVVAPARANEPTGPRFMFTPPGPRPGVSVRLKVDGKGL